ncbi:T9SS type B sorting domain-containing protein [Flavobacterium hibernum]|uniref:T9SS C-terminal target domain-containing protein n=1 Tax=Flavobacterium hibernum TaxID=37752 RepID=A0A0D0EWF9_9FLAO|nr:T9SS type B sorting domain-containing protein [Flavobacterium hibernum]KIO53273.1 hypothetical protein IW18_08150 [Flavobacterium hibernum]OXA87873.1 T9SS C-terminal target domain-containing protein [Flavobacterium hibernum]STO10461.1 Uncharacterized protein conserved in bacteria [Flavobacterium hibernum]
MKQTLFILFLLFSVFSYSQENCNNGIDDDGDGKIDLNDEDCICNNSTINSIIPNPSFEVYAKCPKSYSELNLATPWIQASGATTDYFNKCGLIAPGIKTAGLDNFPDGNGIVGAIFKKDFQEYVGSTLLSPMKAGVNYQLTLNIAALSLNGEYKLTNDKYEPVNLTLFGCINGDNLPIQTSGGPTSADPTWVELGHTTYSSSPNWGEITIFFTPKTDINAIILGAPDKLPASYPESGSGLFPYFLYDNLLLNTTESFGINITQNGNFCDNTLVLKANLTTAADPTKTYQWYHNGIAIVGATNDFYKVASVDTNLGQYSVKLTDDSNCLISRNFTINNIIPSPTYTTIQPNCVTPSGTITITTPGSEYSFDNGLTWQNDASKSALKVGEYGIKIKTLNGCISLSSGVSLLPPKMLDYPEVIATQPLTCDGKGSITIKSAIATQYSFDDGMTWTTNPVKDNVEPGNYLIKIKDATECQSSGQYSSIYQKYLDNPVFKIIQPTCGKAGQISVTTVADQYSFDNGDTWTNDPVLPNLSGGYYRIKIKNNNGCESNTAYASVEPYRIPIYPSYTSSQPLCGTGGTIKITSTASDFSFDGGKTWTKDPVASNLLPGVYEIIIKNDSGCISYTQFVSLDYFYLPNPSFTSTKPTCETGGSITITTSATEYSFDNGKTWSTNATASNLKAGTYYIMIKNEIGCTSSTYHYVNLDNFYLPDPKFNTVNPYCGNIGSIEITTKADFYSFNGGQSWTTNPIKSNLSTDSYNIKIKNSFGCESRGTWVYLNSSYLASPNYEVIQPSCKTKGSITITTKSDLYSFDNGSTWTTNPVLSDLIKNNYYYYIKIKNNKGCESSSTSIYIESAPRIPSKPTITSVSPSNCGTKDASITITTSAVLYSFDDGLTWGTNSKSPDLEAGTYLVRIKESALACPSEATEVVLNSTNILNAPSFTSVQPTCATSTGTITINTTASQYSFDNGLTWQAENSKSNFLPGDYLVKIKNDKGCISNASSVKINTYVSFKISSYSSEQPLCEGGSPRGLVIKIDTPASAYSFDNGLTWTNDPVATNLKENTEYCLRIKNSEDCISEPSCMTTIKQVAIPTAPQITTKQPSGCDLTGSIIVNASKGEYSFDDGKTWSKNATSQPLIPGTYFVRTKEVGSLCISDATQTIINNPPNAPQSPVTTVAQPLSCVNPFGSIKITSLASEYSFDGGKTWTTNTFADNLAVGTYSLKAKNAAGCESNAVSIKIESPLDYPNPPEISISQPDCSNLKGQITISSNSSNYSFDNGLTWTTAKISDYLIPGDYDIRVKNSDGCISDPTRAIINPFTNFPPLPTGSKTQQFCIDEIASLENIVLTGTAIKWYDAPTNGNILPETTLLQNNIYYASQTLNNCESPRFAITVKIQDTQIPIADSPQAFCIQKNVSINDIDIIGQNIKWFESASSTIALSESTPLENGITYYGTQTLNNCESDRIPVTINILDATHKDCINLVDELPFPKFFTPNDDGYNDTWSINFDYLAPNSTIRIYDRYGKLLKQLSKNTSWNGTYTGQDLPASDYWFTVTRANGTEFRGHFSLKR